MPGVQSSQKSSKIQVHEKITGSPDSWTQRLESSESKRCIPEPRATSKEPTHYKDIVHLWEFLLELLEKENCRAIITWTRKDLREFKIRSPQQLARRWGTFKKNNQMNYEHLSRSLRYYYKKGIINKVPKRRLMYRFHKLPYSYVPGVTRSRHHGARLGACIEQPEPGVTESRCCHMISELPESGLTGPRQNSDRNNAYIVQQTERQEHSNRLQTSLESAFTSYITQARKRNSSSLVSSPLHPVSWYQHSSSLEPIFYYAGSKIISPTTANAVTFGFGPVVAIKPVEPVVSFAPAVPVAATTAPAIRVSVIKRI